jgi:transposase-like protein
LWQLHGAIAKTVKGSKMAEKAVNYTPEQTAQVVQDYLAGVSVESIAEALGKSTRSIVAKLSREGVYKKKEYVTKTGEPVQKKDQTADAIGAILRLSEADTDSLAKANKRALKAIFEALANSKPL